VARPPERNGTESPNRNQTSRYVNNAAPHSTAMQTSKEGETHRYVGTCSSTTPSNLLANVRTRQFASTTPRVSPALLVTQHAMWKSEPPRQHTVQEGSYACSVRCAAHNVAGPVLWYKRPESEPLQYSNQYNARQYALKGMRNRYTAGGVK